MRKIISILVALGLVLGLVVMVTPTAAQECGPGGPVAVVSVNPACACAGAAYNITWNISASLTEGVGCVCIEFPAGTTVPTDFDDGVIKIGPSVGPFYDVFGDEVTVTGTKVCFIPPHDIDPGEIMVQFLKIAGIENPCTPGDYVLKAATCRAPDATPLEGEYEIVPVESQFGFLYDFTPTYPDLARGFVPPFQACGQEPGVDYTTYWGPTEDPLLAEGWYDPFYLWILPFVVGCEAPCEEATLWFELTSIPEDEVINLWLGGVVYNLTVCNLTKTVGEFDGSTDVLLTDALPLTPDEVAAMIPGLLHFSSPGDYTIAFYLECPKGTCTPGGIVASNVQTFKVYQKKAAYKLTLCEKWNLFSLPLVPLGSTGSIPIALALASIQDNEDLGQLPLKSQIVSIWYYDAFTEAWKVWTADTTDVDTLTTLEDGKAYWMRVNYPLDEITDGAITCCGIPWWIWGTEKPEPPASPSEYAVNLGWNMVGFTSTSLIMNPDDYLWNWGTPYPVVYGYTDNCWNLQAWDKIDWAGDLLVPGEGYWVSFPKAGSIFVP